MAGNFRIDDGGSVLRAEIGLRAIAGRKDNVSKLVRGAARSAAFTMKALAPVGKTGGLVRRIDWTDAEYRPGGLGGGGTWVARAGVRVGDPYPSNVFSGTGIYGPRGQEIRARPGNIMVIEGYKPRDFDRSKRNPILGKPRAGPIFTRTIKGQRAQQDWFRAGIERAQAHVAFYYGEIFERDSDVL